MPQSHSSGAQIRFAAADDHRGVQDLYYAAFPESERDRVAQLANELLRLGGKTSQACTFALAADVDHTVVGHIAFSPVRFVGDNNVVASLLAPLAVHPDWQSQGIGSRLIASGIDHLMRRNTDIVFVYGDPKFYGRHDFAADVAEQHRPPYDLEFPFGWQARILNASVQMPESSFLQCVVPLRDPSLW